MEVKESAACGISLREFVAEFDDSEIADMYRVLRYVATGEGFYDEEFVEDLMSQMVYIIGPSVEEEPEKIEESTMKWEDTGSEFQFHFNEPEAAHLYRVLNAAEAPGEGFDKELVGRLMSQMMEMAPSVLSDLPVINR
jgi:hypothetical protein